MLCQNVQSPSQLLSVIHPGRKDYSCGCSFMASKKKCQTLINQLHFHERSCRLVIFRYHKTQDIHTSVKRNSCTVPLKCRNCTAERGLVGITSTRMSQTGS